MIQINARYQKSFIRGILAALALFVILTASAACRSSSIGSTAESPAESASRKQPDGMPAYPGEFSLVSDEPIGPENDRGDDLYYRFISLLYPFSSLDPENFHIGGQVCDPVVLFEDGKYKMWFSGVKATPFDDSGGIRPDRGLFDEKAGQLIVQGIAYSESVDGLNWTDTKDRDQMIRLILEPEDGDWDKAGYETPCVIRNYETGEYYMYYTGKSRKDDGSNYFSGIGMAVSTDGISWEKIGHPVIEAEFIWETEYSDLEFFRNSDRSASAGGILEPAVLYDEKDGLYKMWYAAMGFSDPSDATSWDVRMGYAESEDGINWVKKTTDPIFERGEAGSWDSSWASHYHVVKDPYEGFHLFYAGSDGDSSYAIGHAYSTDGIHWIRNANNPVFSNSPGSWHEAMTGGPSVMILENAFHMFFFGSKREDFTGVYFGYLKAPYVTSRD